MKVIVISNYNKGESKKCTSELVDIFEKTDTFYVLKEYQQDDGFFLSLEDKINEADMVIAVGGDGTIIHTAKAAAELDKPVLGINSGYLGFTAELECSDLTPIYDILKGDFQLEKRMLIEASLISGDKITKFSALNDAVVSTELSNILDYTMAIDGRKEYEYRADGVIIATPTGSTAYSLSAGGPVVEPTVNCMIYTPICPHSMFNRSVIYAPDTEIEMSIKKNKSRVFLTIDGKKPAEIHTGDKIKIRKSDLSASFVNINSKSFYDTLNRKMIGDISKAGGI